ncbi:MAG: hypothetical protein KF901_14620 [Myxococcales bacterium]|nr:hypothetical protein [Myxococcales bacterium]
MNQTPQPGSGCSGRARRARRVHVLGAGVALATLLWGCADGNNPAHRRDGGAVGIDAGGADGGPSDGGSGVDATVDASAAPDGGGADGGACAAPLTRCGGACVDVMTDVNACGGCGRVCEAPIGGSPRCASGTCETECPAGQTDCGGTCRTTSEACSAGVGACARAGVTVCSPTGTSCGATPGTPQAETCNGIDDDCDGQIDEGHRAVFRETTYTQLSTHHSPCNGSTERWGRNCFAASHRACAAFSACVQSGFGPVENNLDYAPTVCAEASVRNLTYAQLAAQHPPCDGSFPNGTASADCNAAIHRWCRANGFVTGWGPVENAAPNVAVACSARAEVINTTFAVLASHHPACDGTNERWGPSCHAAIHRFCNARGRRGGFGPLENSGGSATVGCVLD